MSIWTKARVNIFNQNQHPYRHSLTEFAYANPRVPSATNVDAILNYIVAVLYPNYIATFADQAALAAYATPQPNDYALVTDDGDGKSAGYVYQVIDAAGRWVKRYDVDWSLEAIFAETINRTQYQYVMKWGMEDKDPATGVDYVGANAGQHIWGGSAASSNLTLHANSGDTGGGRTGNIRLDDTTVPTADSTLDLGTTALRWLNVWTDSITTGTMTATGGSITDSSGAISFGDENLTTTGNITGATGFFSAAVEVGPLAGSALLLAAGSITDESGAISFGDENLSTTGTLASGTHTITPGASQLVLAVGSITSATGAISFGDENLSTTGTLSAGATTVTQLDSDNIRIDLNTISVTNLNGNLNLNANGTGVVAVGSSMTTGAITATGTVGVTGQLDADNLRIDGNTLSSTSGDLILSSAGLLTVNNTLQPDGNNTRDLGTAALAFRSLYLDTGLGDGTNSFTIAELLSLRSANYRDAGRTTPAVAGDTIFWDGTQWLASAPDTEIAHGSISGLTTGDAGHTQFVMLAGRAGGQTVQGGTAASEELLLESTANVTKGSVRTKDNFTPNTNASYAGGWSGTDLGDSTHYFRDVYTKGEHFGFRLENVAAPANSAQNIGRMIYDSGVTKVDSGAAWINLIDNTADQTVGGVKTFSSYIQMAEVAAPATPAAGFGRLYAGTDGKPYFLNDAGTTFDLSAATTVSVSAVKVANYTALTTDNVILVDSSGGTFTVTLYAAAGNTGRVLRIKKIDSDTSFTAVTIDGNASETIDGETTTTLNTFGECLTIVCDGSNWHILERDCNTEWVTDNSGVICSWTGTTLTRKWRRVGDEMEVDIYLDVDAPSGTLAFRIPGGLTFDTTKMSVAAGPMGIAYASDASAGVAHQGFVYYSDADDVIVQGGSTTISTWNTTFPFTAAAGDDYVVRYKGPISGWKS